MQRRQHKKSRKGCVECKRRHIRPRLAVQCDEQLPSCINCSKVERACIYSSSRRCIEYDGPSGTSRSVGRISTETRPRPRARNEDKIDHDVNMLHMDLLLHFTFDIFVPEFDASVREKATRIVLELALQEPFLMHEILAISARHLAIIRSENAVQYLDHAVRLQTKAIELFSRSPSQNIIDKPPARLLFSSILGRHMLADALLTNSPGLPQFLHRFLQSVRIHRGMKVIVTDEHWRALVASDVLGPLMLKGLDKNMYDNPDELKEPLLSLLKRATENCTGGDRLAYEKALRFVEMAIMDLRDPATLQQGQRMMFMWSIMIPDRFVDLLDKQTPEAIAILGRFAILLHFGKGFWQIGDAGPYLLKLVTEFLGTGWGEWLEWPMGLQLPT